MGRGDNVVKVLSKCWESGECSTRRGCTVVGLGVASGDWEWDGLSKSPLPITSGKGELSCVCVGKVCEGGKVFRGQTEAAGKGGFLGRDASGVGTPTGVETGLVANCCGREDTWNGLATPITLENRVIMDVNVARG